MRSAPPQARGRALALVHGYGAGEEALLLEEPGAGLKPQSAPPNDVGDFRRLGELAAAIVLNLARVRRVSAIGDAGDA